MRGLIGAIAEREAFQQQKRGVRKCTIRFIVEEPSCPRDRAAGDRFADEHHASCYRASPRPYTGVLPPQEYPGHYLVKKITTGGTFKFQGRLLFLATPLVHHHIGLEEVDAGIWNIYFNRVLLAKLDERDYIIRG